MRLMSTADGTVALEPNLLAIVVKPIFRSRTSLFFRLIRLTVDIELCLIGRRYAL